MRVKPQMALWVVAMAALLSYGIVSLILSHRETTQTNISENQELKSLPAAVFFDAAGKKLTLADFKGRPVLLNLWATWCPPCVGELPSLDKLQAKLKKEGLAVVAISMDHTDDMKAITAFLDKHRIEHLAPYCDRDREVAEKWDAQTLPVTWFIGRDGTVKKKFEGPYFWDQTEMVKTVQGLITK
jgi:thiol-disulfide isomerase/thioredoxin